MRVRHFPVLVLLLVLLLCSGGRSASAGPVKIIAGTSLIADVLQDLCGGRQKFSLSFRGPAVPGTRM